MPEFEDENRTYSPKLMLTGTSPPLPPKDSPMDLDLDGPWSFDQIFTSNSMSPFFFSTSEQPYSPLWTFSDDKPLENFSSTLAADLLIENEAVTGERRKQSAPILGLIPVDYPDASCLLKERMTQALRHFKDSTEQHVLAQVWAPVKNGSRYVLTTSEQPFVLDPNSTGLYKYRTVSLMYSFSVDGESDGVLGLPGRVFLRRMPEWTPNVQYYSSKEYPRLNHAQHYDVRGTLALPVFEPSGHMCIGVLELIMTSQKTNYAHEVDKVCKALEAVNLKSSEILDYPETQICNEGRQNALAEILEILTVVCEINNLPLAQTWVPCMHRSILADGGGLKKSCRSFDGSCIGRVCMSTTDAAFYVVDAHMWGFREACAEHHLQKGQGVVGRAFSSHNSCFCEDITQFRKTEYPLVHYARMFGLTSSFAICLRSTHTGNDEYILEFFLPLQMKDARDQQKLLDSLLITMKQHFQSLQVASGEELEEAGKCIEIITAPFGEKDDPEPESNFQKKKEPVILQLTEQQLCTVKANGGIQTAAVDSPENKVVPTKKSERKRGKAEKSISLDVLQQYFAGSLKDAAKSLGVCPTTMKRICRQHGISRWPSRKINKVNRSLSKLKHVIESVQGADATFTINSIATTNPIPISVGSLSWPNQPKPTEVIPPEAADDSSLSKSGSGSRDESAGTPTSHGSCQGGNPQNANIQQLIINTEQEEQQQPTRKIDLSAAFLVPESLFANEPFGAMLIEDAGSSHNLGNLLTGGGQLQTGLEYLVNTNRFFPSSNSPPEGTTVTIKASYKEDIIRFRFQSGSGIVKLREEIGKRLKLEVGTFDVKYFDDDQEWVLIACDTDLQECLDVTFSGSNIIRLLIQEITVNLGSSCESSE
ncbi:protein NLP6-like [Impatiens glandulifera]|uniref:protein NLP6-like n=1 Tax=Impatiens glandulifera TaxID=253017 RepID=UPI001FB12F3F|nr:protein NLP6-like [Impatiens glandulifera]